MNKAGICILVTLLLSGNIVTLGWLIRERALSRERMEDAIRQGALASKLEESIAALGAKVDLWSESQRARPSRAEPGEPAAEAKTPDALLERLAAIEKMLADMRNVDSELAAAKLKEEREKLLGGEDGYVAADELLAEKSFALAANAYLKFLELHPDHPDARDLMQKARDAFRSAGYTEKAFWVHQEMMKRFPGSRGDDLMSLAQMEKDARRLDEAIQHAGESAELASIEEDRVWRLMYRAWFMQLRNGDAAGLQAYREVEQLAETLGMGDKNPGKKVKEKIAEIEQRLVQGR